MHKVVQKNSIIRSTKVLKAITTASGAGSQIDKVLSPSVMLEFRGNVNQLELLPSNVMDEFD